MLLSLPAGESRSTSLRIFGMLLWGIFLALHPAAVPAQQNFPGKTIRKISIRGLKRLSEVDILAKLKLRIGQAYDPIEVSNEAGRLFLMGHFSQIKDPIDVKEFEDGVEIIFTVTEKPVIKSVTFQALDTNSGKTSFGLKDLQEPMTTKSGGMYSPAVARIDVKQIDQVYRDRGYLFVEVDHLVKELADGIEVVFTIKEGPRVRIHDISFTGNKTVKEGALERQMAIKEKDWFFGLINPGYYDQGELKRDLENIEEYYQGIGFFDVLVAVNDLDFYSLNAKLRIQIAVEEGPRYTFTGYRFEGNKVFSALTLQSLTRNKPGTFFSGERLEQDRREILKYYRDRAYIDASVDTLTIVPEEGHTVEVLFRIQEEYEIYIDQVHIRGNLKTQDRVIRRELEFYPGEKFNGSRLEKSRSNLARLQIFGDVDYDFEPGSKPDRRNVVVKVDEQPTGRILFGVGVTSGLGVIGNISVTKRNFDLTDLPDSIYDIPDSFTGAGQTLNLVIQPGTRRSLYQFTFIEPYLFESRNSLELTGSYIRTRRYRGDYDENRLSLRPRIGHAFDFDRDLVFSVGTRFEQVEINHIDSDAPPDVFDVEGFTTLFAANASLTYDKVLYEPLEGPYAGHRERLFYEYGGEPLPGEVDFHKIEGSLELYYPIYIHEEGHLHHVISLFSKFGFMEGHHQTDSLPIFERFFLGGPNTVRGFDIWGVGPHFGRDPLGGTTEWYGNIEYVFPLFQKILRGVIFLDYGNLSADQVEFDVETTRFAAGGGLRINFPFLGTPLPIGLYLGQAFIQQSEDRPRLFLFTIGAPF
ncbi:MAG: outer membrane protein assembly factor BamA [Planctomycetes bacterium]|nr:outer membrane protein assembly factor BamA [Planctomycetota bacterium]